MNLCGNLSRSSCVKGDRQGLLIVPSPSGGGLGWGASHWHSEVADSHDFTPRSFDRLRTAQPSPSRERAN